MAVTKAPSPEVKELFSSIQNAAREHLFTIFPDQLFDEPTVEIDGTPFIVVPEAYRPYYTQIPLADQGYSIPIYAINLQEETKLRFNEDLRMEHVNGPLHDVFHVGSVDFPDAENDDLGNPQTTITAAGIEDIIINSSLNQTIDEYIEARRRFYDATRPYRTKISIPDLLN